MLIIIRALLVALIVIPSAAALAETTSAHPAAMDAIGSPAGVNIIHDQLTYIVPNKRSLVKATISGTQGVKVVRCYFKVADGSEYLFVPMTPLPDKTDEYQGTLPGMSSDTKSIEYRFLVVAQDGKITKTQPLMTLVKRDAPLPDWQKNFAGNGNEEKKQERLALSVESPNAFQSADGIADNISLNIIESAARYITVASSTITVSSTAAAVGATTATSGTAMATAAVVPGTQATAGTAVANSSAVTGQAAVSASTTTVSASTLAAVAGGIVAVGTLNMSTNAGGPVGIWTATLGTYSCTSNGISGIQFLFGEGEQIYIPSNFNCSGLNSTDVNVSCSGGISGSQINISYNARYLSGSTTNCSGGFSGSISSGTIKQSCSNSSGSSISCSINWTNGSLMPM